MEINTTNICISHHSTLFIYFLVKIHWIYNKKYRVTIPAQILFYIISRFIPSIYLEIGLYDNRLAFHILKRPRVADSVPLLQTLFIHFLFGMELGSTLVF